MFNMQKGKFTSILVILLMVTPFLFDSRVFALKDINDQEHSLANIDYSSWYWTETEVLPIDSDHWSWYPEMVFDSVGNIHLTWMDLDDIGSISGSDQDIWYMKWDASTETWGDVVLVSDISDASSRGSLLTVDSNDNLHFLWVDAANYLGSGTDYDLFYRNYNPTTEVWSTVEVLTPLSTAVAYLPDMVMDVDGNIHVVYVDATPYGSVGSDEDIWYLRRSSSTGLWDPPELLSQGSDETSSQPALTVTSGNIAHFVWEEDEQYDFGADTDIYHKKKDLNTGIWDPTLTLISRHSNNISQYPSICSDSQNTVHIIWSDLIYSIEDADELEDLFYLSWDSITNEWSPEAVVIGDGYDRVTLSDIYADLFDNLHIVYEDTFFGDEADQLYYKSKLAESDEWSLPVKISSESDAWDHQTYYGVTVDSKGYVHVFWSDDSDYNGAGTDYDLFYKKLVGPPPSPLLLEIYPKSTTANKQVNLAWIETFGATSYKIYRSTTYITDISSLTSIGSSSSSSFTDTLTSPGIYYYVITAVSGYGESTFSNVVSVEVPSSFENFDWNMMLILGGILLGSEIFLAIIIYFLLSSKIKKSRSKKTGKKKSKKK